MKITDEQSKKIKTSINKNIPEGIKCPICGKNDWVLGEYIAEIPLETNNKGVVIVPVVMISCNNCGNMQLFNAFKLGVVNEDVDDDDHVHDKNNDLNQNND